MRSLRACALWIAISALSLATSSSAMAQSTEGKSSSQDVSIASEQLPDSPGTTWARAQEPAQQTNPAPAVAPAGDSSAQVSDKKMQRPVGTAAAEAPKVSGITAAQPAGVAIAPAKQRRVRVLVLKVGAILGASAALGTVIALSAATPSKPPGAH